MTDYIKNAKMLVSEKSGVDASEITSESFFEEDLNISELELIEILTDLEDTYEISLIENKDEIETFGDLVDLLTDEVE